MATGGPSRVLPRPETGRAAAAVRSFTSGTGRIFHTPITDRTTSVAAKSLTPLLLCSWRIDAPYTDQAPFRTPMAATAIHRSPSRSVRSDPHHFAYLVPHGLQARLASGSRGQADGGRRQGREIHALPLRRGPRGGPEAYALRQGAVGRRRPSRRPSPILPRQGLDGGRDIGRAHCHGPGRREHGHLQPVPGR